MSGVLRPTDVGCETERRNIRQREQRADVRGEPVLLRKRFSQYSSTVFASRNDTHLIDREYVAHRMSPGSPRFSQLQGA